MFRRISLALALTAAACGTIEPSAQSQRSSLRRDHRSVVVSRGQPELFAELRAKSARTLDYGSFWVLQLPRDVRPELESVGDVVRIDGFPISASDPEATYARVPSKLKIDHLGAALTRGVAPPPGLYIVQLAGPVQDEWLELLELEGLERVHYIPDNAYVVRADERGAKSLVGLLERFSFVQLIGDYEPAFRVAPELRALDRTGLVDLNVQVVDGPNAQATVREISALSSKVLHEVVAAGYRNVAITVDASRIVDLAHQPDVFSIERRAPPTRFDEAHGQIVAGNVSGATAVLGAGYVSWHDGQGFDASQFGSFFVNVVDDSHDLSGHGDLPLSRVPFQSNYTSAPSTQGGHGFLNSHIVGGSNVMSGVAFEDARGFNYGQGIAPYARVGVTDIFGPSNFDFGWEVPAYAAGARVSSNSWGFTGFNEYEFAAQLYDTFVRDAQGAVMGNQEYAIVFAAANSGPTADSVFSPATAKNLITVGASENDRQTGTDGCGISNTGANDVRDMIGFSSRGPVNLDGGDGRIKPDIVAPGTHVQAGVPQSDFDQSSVCNGFFPVVQTLYGWSSGTSHACPAIAGAAALVYQDFLNRSLPAPSPAMIKAQLMNTATHMTGVGANDTLPSNNQGMGRVNLSQTLDATPRLEVDQTQLLANTGASHVVTGVVSSNALPFRVSLVWTDAPGATTAAPWVNDLNLTVTVGGSTYRGNVFSGANSVTGGAADIRNNAEHVFLPAGVSGPFTVTITAANIAGDGVPGNGDATDQDFALVIYNATAPPTIDAQPTSLSFSATEGGASPAGQALDITNVGGGSLVWSATDDQPWLSIAAANGTAPSSPTVSENITGLAAGTYNGNIGITGVDATNTPLTVPVTLTVDPAPVGFVVNGGFETTLSPWVRRGSTAVFEPKASAPHGGLGDLRCGGGVNDTAFVYQQLTLPAMPGSADLGFWLRIASSEVGLSRNDRLLVEVRSTTNALLATVGAFSNLDASGFASFTQVPNADLLAFAGQTIRLYFRCSNNASLPTTFFIDDVTLD